MRVLTVRRLLGVVCLAVMLWLAFGLVMRPGAETAAEGGGRYVLEAPPFVRIAAAEAGSPETVEAFPVDEAGISAWFGAGTTINLNDVRDAYRTVEYETAQYIVGSVPAPGGYGESEDAHVYVHVNGWFLAYYLATDPAAKVFDWLEYRTNSSQISTKLEDVLLIVASEAGVPYPDPGATFYDFRYPNATRLMLIAETAEGGNNFTVELPTSYTFYERSWGLLMYNHGDWFLDGVQIFDGYCGSGNFPNPACITNQGLLTAAQLSPGLAHTIAIEGGDDYGGLALVYRE